MTPPTTRTFTPARIVALACIGLTALGLAYLRFGTGDSSVTVPKGARAGQLTMHPCSYDTEQGSYAADCGTLVVRENRADPRSRLIALPVKRIRARSAHPAEPLFRLEGGPGITNMSFSKASRFAENRDVGLVGYRGVDGSERLDCPEVESALKHSKDLLSEKSFTAYADGFRDCAARLTDGGVDLAGYTIPAEVDDLEAARQALGYGKIDLVSESAGTRTALIYAWRYPQAIHRSVMIGANPPGNFVWSGKWTDAQLRKYSALCAADETCHRRADDLVATLKRTNADIPDSYFGLPIKRGNVRVASFYGLVETTSENAPLTGPMTLGSWMAADDGDASGFWLQSVLSDLAFPQVFVWGQMAAMGHIDAAAAKRHFANAGSDGEILGNPGGEFLWAGGKLADAWPAARGENEYSRVRRSNVETLVISGDLDFATPPQVATTELMPYLPNGHQVVLKGFGHSGSVWSDQADAGTHLINTYLATGKVDRSHYKPQRVDFTPEVTQTALGKGIAAGLPGLAALTVLSLLWMTGWGHRRRRYGRKSSAMLRSFYAVVLGFGGWFVGVLIVVTTMPGTPLDDELLAALSVSAPVGLGLYLAWSDRDRPARARAAGFAAALAGSLLGGWLGFHVAEGLLALLTTIAGAIAGGNLALVTLDIRRDRQARVRSAEPAPKALPSIG